MPKQHGGLRLEGSLGDLTFYKSKYGYLVKRKSIVPGERQAVDPAYQRTRENNEEFGTASKASKLIREACGGLPMSMVNGPLRARLMKTLLGIIRKDSVNPKGKRQVLDEHAALLEGFEFNENAAVRSVLKVPFGVEVDRMAGAVSLAIPSFDPQRALARPEGTTHFKLVMGGAAIHFPSREYGAAITSSAYLPYRSVTGMQNLVVSIAAGCVHPIFVMLGVVFYQEMGGRYYELSNATYQALGIVKVVVG